MTPRSKRGRRGSALVELVVVTPLLLLVLIGLVEAGRAGDFAIQVGSAARAGVQYGAQNLVTALDDTGMESAATTDAGSSAVTAVASHMCECENGSVSASCLPSYCSTSHQIVFVQVITSGTIPSLFNYAPLPASLRTISVTGKAIMRVAP
jgi:Flp pilus assembly protein TadG